MAHIGARISNEKKEIITEHAEQIEKTVSEVLRDLLDKYIMEEIKIELK